MRLKHLTLSAFLALPFSALADTTTTLNVSTAGWCYGATSCDNTSLNSGVVQNSDASADRNNFYTFDLSGVSGTITSATLAIWDSSEYGSGGYYGDGSYSVYEATGMSYSGLQSGDAFATIGTGSLMGGTYVDIALDAEGLNALTQGEGGMFTLSGSVGANSLDVFGYGDGNPVAQLVVTSAQTPEPSSLALLGTAVLAGAGEMRRRFKRAA